MWIYVLRPRYRVYVLFFLLILKKKNKFYNTVSRRPRIRTGPKLALTDSNRVREARRAVVRPANDRPNDRRGTALHRVAAGKKTSAVTTRRRAVRWRARRPGRNKRIGDPKDTGTAIRTRDESPGAKYIFCKCIINFFFFVSGGEEEIVVGDDRTSARRVVH